MKRILAMLLTVTLLLGCIPAFGVLASDESVQGAAQVETLIEAFAGEDEAAIAAARAAYDALTAD